MRAPLLVKLLVALVLPTLALFALFAVVAYEVSRRDLDDELGKRLTAIASSAAAPVRGKYLAPLAAGNEQDRGYLNAVDKLRAIASATGVHLFVVDRGFDLHGDAPSGERGGAAIGTHDYHTELDRAELDRVFTDGAALSSVSFTGNDGVSYKTGYAPIRACADCEPADRAIVLVLAAQAPASYFDRLDDMARQLVIWGAGLAAVSVAAAALAALLITRNLRKLAAAAERIGAGDLRARITVGSRDELGVLADAMDKMREQLAERDAQAQRMLAGIAHEVRNPLAGMTLFTGILRDELPADDERRGHVLRIERELGYLERVVNDFLEFARRAPPDKQPIELAELLEEVAQLAGGDVAVSAARELTVAADRSQLRRALLNLVKNALAAARDAGETARDAVRISARTGETAHEIAIDVRNRGAEIPPEVSGKLFDPFFTTRENGTGLGLAFVREIAIDHGGRVEVAREDHETRFTLVLPQS